MTSSKSHLAEQGYILVALLVTTIFVLIAGAATAQLALNNYQSAIHDRERLAAQFAADAGADDSIKLLNDDYGNSFSVYNGTTTEKTIYSGSDMRTTYKSTIAPVTGDTYTRVLTVTGKTYSPASSTSPIADRTYIINLRAVTEGDFSVVAGVGGLNMSNSAKIVGGNLYVNGRVNMSGSSQIGLSSKPLSVISIANYSCGTGSSFPRACADGENDNPLSITSPAWVYGDVKANWQKSSARISNTGVVQSSGIAKKDYPYQDRTPIKSAISSTYTGDITCSSGSLSWPANYKIVGNVTVRNGCQITVFGNVWITGILTMSQTGSLKVDNSLTTPPTIMIDGIGGLAMGNSATLASNSSNVGFRIITYWSAAGCSPDCSTVTGTDLINSKDTTTISLSQTASGPNTEFVAHWSQLSMGNSGGVGALAGQTINLSNSAAVTFGATVTGIGGISNWIIKDYRRSFTPL